MPCHGGFISQCLNTFLIKKLKRIHRGNLLSEIFPHSLIYIVAEIQFVHNYSNEPFSQSQPSCGYKWDVKTIRQKYLWRFYCRFEVAIENMTKKKREKNQTRLHTNPHVFSGWKGLLEQERWEAEGECGGGGRKQEEGGGIVMYLLAAAMHWNQNHLHKPLCFHSSP